MRLRERKRTDESAADEARRLGRSALTLALLLALVNCDPRGFSAASEDVGASASASDGDAPTSADASPSAPSAPSAPIVVHLEAPPGAEGQPRALHGLLRIEDDEGVVLREAAIDGSSVRVDALPEGPYVLRIQVAGFARETRAIRTPHEPIAIALSPVARVSGLVLGPDELPHRARVRIVGSGIWPAREIETEADGTFVFDDVPAGLYELEGHEGALVAAPRRGIDVAPESSTFLRLHLEEGRFLVGRVLDARGRAVALAELTASEGSISPSAHTAVSETDGSYRVGPFASERVFVDVRAAGFAPSVARGCVTTTPCIVTLSEGASLRGRVLDVHGAPIADAAIEVEGEGPSRAPIAMSTLAAPLGALVFDPTRRGDPSAPIAPSEIADEAVVGLGVTTQVPPIPLTAAEDEGALGEPGSEGARPPSSAPAIQTRLRTDARGEFVVTGLPPGRVELVARAPGYRATRSARLTLGPGQQREGVELVLREGGAVHGSVVDERGRAADARIEARVEDDPVPRYVTTGRRGEFRIEDVGGTVLLYVTSEGYAPIERVVRVEGGEAPPVRVTLADPSARLRVRVVDPRGERLDGVMVRVESLTAGTGTPRLFTSDANGEIEASPLPAYPLLVQARDPRFLADPVIVRGDAPIVLTLARPLSVDARFVDAWTDEPLRGVELTLLCTDAPACLKTARTHADGAAQLDGLRPGRYEWEARLTGYATVRRSIELRAPRRGREITLDTTSLEPGLRLEGDVVDRFGRAVEGAEISVDTGDELAPITAESDARGHFALEGVPRGRRSIVVRHASAGERVERIEIRRDRDPAPIVVRLPERDDGAVRVADRPAREVGIGVGWDPSRGPLVLGSVSGPSRRAGLLPGDEVRSIDGTTPHTIDEARRLLQGALFVPALVELRRGGSTFFVRVPRAWGDSGARTAVAPGRADQSATRR